MADLVLTGQKAVADDIKVKTGTLETSLNDRAGVNGQEVFRGGRLQQGREKDRVFKRSIF
jgi:hypothetical protein